MSAKYCNKSYEVLRERGCILLVIQIDLFAWYDDKLWSNKMDLIVNFTESSSATMGCSMVRICSPICGAGSSLHCCLMVYSESLTIHSAMANVTTGIQCAKFSSCSRLPASEYIFQLQFVTA